MVPVLAVTAQYLGGLALTVAAVAAVAFGVDSIVGRDRRVGADQFDWSVFFASDSAAVPDADHGDVLVPQKSRQVGTPPDDRLHRVYEQSELLQVDHLRGMDTIDELLTGMARAVVEARQRSRRRPRRPTSILLHGPPGGAMTIVVHALAWRLRARIVQIAASRAVPDRDGGSQPQIAGAMHEARDHLPSVLVIDEFEHVAGADVKDAAKQRAANDLINESLRPMYEMTHLVIGLFTSYPGQALPARLETSFERVVHVDVPEIERALVVTALQNVDGDLFRVISGARLAQRPDVTGGWATAA